jgi:hypothetical protein
MTALDKLLPGESVTYHSSRGLAHDRGGKKHATIVAAADEAWQAAVRGEVDLSQRRRSDGGIDYLARRRRKVDPRPVLPALTLQERRMQSAMALQSVRPMRWVA